MKGWLALAAHAAVCSIGAGVHASSYHNLGHLDVRQSSSVPVVRAIPSYNATLPIDHFTASDTRTFNNRFFVNDTYYKAGGPVILFDFGPAAFSEATVARYLGEHNGSVSAPMELAKALNGVVVGWEHRFYGTSLPFAVNGTGDINRLSVSAMLKYAGVPLEGVAAYKYLTVEQALQDIVYFATNVFNRTELGGNNTVLAGAGATSQLDPSRTPWIWVGGGKAGSRGAWLRVRNPEVVHAVWASSAAVEARVDGSARFNPIARALPANCSADMHAVGKQVDGILSSSNSPAIMDLKTSVLAAMGQLTPSSSIVRTKPDELTDFMIAYTLLADVTDQVAAYGVHNSVQIFCDFMASFNVKAFLEDPRLNDNNITTKNTYFLQNKGDGLPSATGIAAAHGDNGPRAAVAAYLYGYSKWRTSSARYGVSEPSDAGLTIINGATELHSSTWLTLTELGLVQAVNASSTLSLGSKFFAAKEVLKESIQDYLPGLGLPLDLEPAVDKVQKYGGWAMQPSNVMFTNGQHDPWRAYSVMSAEQEIGAPARAVSQEVPKCGTTPAGTDVFGLLYSGAVHQEDMLWRSGQLRGWSDPANLPVRIGSELFVKAYKEWTAAGCLGKAPAPSNNSGTMHGASIGRVTVAVIMSALVPMWFAL